MDLMDADQGIVLCTQRRRHAAAVLLHLRGLVRRPDAAVEGGIDPVRDATLAGEEGMADAGMGGEGRRSISSAEAAGMLPAIPMKRKLMGIPPTKPTSAG